MRVYIRYCKTAAYTYLQHMIWLSYTLFRVSRYIFFCMCFFVWLLWLLASLSFWWASLPVSISNLFVVFCFWLFLRLLAWVGVVGPPLDVRYMYYISLMILGVIFVDIRLWHESTYDSRHATCHYPMIESVFFIVWDYSQQSKVRLTRDSHH